MTSEWLQIGRCPLCDSDQYKVLIPPRHPEQMEVEKILEIYKSSSDDVLMDQVVRCQGCELIYLNPRIKDDIILKSYADATDPTFFSQNKMRIKTFTAILSSILKKEKITAEKNKHILDVGCAGGAFLKAAHEIGFSVTGIEPSQWLCKQGEKEYGLDIRPGVLSDHSFAPEQFFMVTLWDVIEHLTNPHQELKKIHSILQTNGYLVINYPDYNSWARRILQGKWPFFLNVHLMYFTSKTISRILKDNGFYPVHIRPHFQTLELGYVLQRAAKIISPIKGLGFLVEKLGLSRWPLTYNMGQTLVVAKKT